MHVGCCMPMSTGHTDGKHKVSKDTAATMKGTKTVVMEMREVKIDYNNNN